MISYTRILPCITRRHTWINSLCVDGSSLCVDIAWSNSSGSHYGCGSWGGGLGRGSAIISGFSEFFYKPYYENSNADYCENSDDYFLSVHFFLRFWFAKIRKSFIFAIIKLGTTINN